MANKVPDLNKSRRWVFLQGPHGPFFRELAMQMQRSGHDVRAILFNQGDAHGFGRFANSDAFVDAPADWPRYFERYLRDHAITDIVLYGDTKPAHTTAIAQAQARGITVHCFEEGYIRPFWVTYERDGTNGNSQLMDIDIAAVEAVWPQLNTYEPSAPSGWGALWHHTWHGCIYHAQILFKNSRFPKFTSHRAPGVAKEWWLHFMRLLLIPSWAVQRWRRTRRYVRGRTPFHVFLLQLAHDSAFTHHSDCGSMGHVIDQVVGCFARGAPRHHHLIFKAHPLEDLREPLPKLVAQAAQRHGVADRVVYVPGGKLAPLLDAARSAITVNSTAGQQVLFRGLPLKILGRCIYGKADFVSSQNLQDFFANPQAPDLQRYRKFRDFLLATSQIRGGFYKARARKTAIRSVIDMMLAPAGPYAIVQHNCGATATKLTVVSG